MGKWVKSMNPKRLELIYMYNYLKEQNISCYLQDSYKYHDKIDLQLVYETCPEEVINNAAIYAFLERRLQCVGLSRPLMQQKDKDLSTETLTFPIPQFVQNIWNFLKKVLK